MKGMCRCVARRHSLRARLCIVEPIDSSASNRMETDNVVIRVIDLKGEGWRRRSLFLLGHKYHILVVCSACIVSTVELDVLAHVVHFGLGLLYHGRTCDNIHSDFHRR